MSAPARCPPVRGGLQGVGPFFSDTPVFQRPRWSRLVIDFEVQRTPKKLPYVPTEHEIRAFYQAVWTARRGQDVVMIKTLLYTGVRVSELVRIRLGDIDLDGCRIRIEQGKGDIVTSTV